MPQLATISLARRFLPLTKRMRRCEADVEYARAFEGSQGASEFTEDRGFEAPVERECENDPVLKARRTFRTPSLGYSSLRGALGGGDCRESRGPRGGSRPLRSF